MIGAYVMTQANCERKEIVPDGIGMAAYGMDSHNTQRLVNNGIVKNEGDVEKGGAGPYPIAYRSLTPKENECKNLLVPVCLSASHIGYGSIRMEPVFMVLGQSAGIAAVLAIDQHTTVQGVAIKRIQQLLKSNPLADGSTPEILVDNEDSAHLEIKGNWSLKKGGTYGPSAYYSAVNDKSKAIKFIPEVSKAGNYDIYTYVLPKLNNASSTATYAVFNGRGEKEVIIRKTDIDIKGQTNGEWVHLGKYNLPAGSKAYVVITNSNADGVIVADAVLFVPENLK
jgi:hypothetical protein